VRVPLVIEPDRDDPDCAEVMVDGTIAGRPYRFRLDTGAARTCIVADDFTAALSSNTQHHSSGVFAASSNALVSVPDLAIGPLTVPDRSPAADAARVLEMDGRGHSYVDVTWPGVTGRACWDSGSGITIVDQAFLLSHLALFEEVGTSVGTDSTGTQAETRIFLMAGPMIGGALFARHKVAMVDLSLANAHLDQPMDLILGYTTLRQADWLFDFPARRWAVTRKPATTRSCSSWQSRCHCTVQRGSSNGSPAASRSR